MQSRPLQQENKSEYVSTLYFTRFASKKYINNNLIHYWAINAVLMTFEAKKSINLFSKSGCPNLHALKSINGILECPPLLLGLTLTSLYYINSIIFIPGLFC